jgi:signal transduction histidine kinase
VARVPVEHFNELILACPEMRELLLPAMAERRRAEYAITSQQQKLAALGKMSAGLAHELNNPAAAARRAAQTLTKTMEDVEALSCELLTGILKETGVEVELIDVCELARHQGGELDALTRSECEDELSDWLRTLKVPQPWDAAASLVAAGLTRKDLEPLASRTTPALAGKLLTWLAKDVEMRLTCQDLQESTTRITDIVCAMKSYSHMDRGTTKAPTDLHQGLDTTITIVKHKARKKNLRFEKRYGKVPPVLAYGGELNQVWTNLLDNAIDASPVDGTIRVRTALEGDQALVEITDQGDGIPPEIRDRIFEPFFTTKPVGDGTGLGLDTSYRIVKNHQGDIRFDSKPSETRFTVRLPLSA